MTFTNYQIGTICFILLFLVWFIISEFWIPKNAKTRILVKTNDIVTYYTAQFYRPIFGWTGFFVSRGRIYVIRDWSSKISCEHYITEFKKIKSNKFTYTIL